MKRKTFSENELAWHAHIGQVFADFNEEHPRPLLGKFLHNPMWTGEQLALWNAAWNKKFEAEYEAWIRTHGEINET